MKTNIVRLEKIIEELSNDVIGRCEATAFIGEVDGNPIMLTVMSKDEAIHSHDYTGTPVNCKCIEQ
jgi:hypothetical protein